MERNNDASDADEGLGFYRRAPLDSRGAVSIVLDSFHRMMTLDDYNDNENDDNDTAKLGFLLRKASKMGRNTTPHNTTQHHTRRLEATVTLQSNAHASKRGGVVRSWTV